MMDILGGCNYTKCINGGKVDDVVAAEYRTNDDLHICV